ncbi:MAG: transcription termination factor Rho [Syntrophaceae bacterium]|nr:transcription termination factor Rho [Syntrophaceae bacterium]
MTEEIHKKEHKEHDEKHLEKLTIKELREIAAEIPHEKAIHEMKKEELVVFIKEARGIKDEAPVKKKKHIGKIKMTKSELKAKIRELKSLRLRALESKERDKALRLRHQISQLKKKSRRLAAA